MRIVLVSPYHSGSHKLWAEGFKKHTKHEVDLLTLSGQLWQWRMQGGAVTLARYFNESQLRPDVFFVTDMLNLPVFRSLIRKEFRSIPVVLYMHENQLIYPLPRDRAKGPFRNRAGKINKNFIFINYSSMLASDRILFNSTYHYESFFQELPNYLKSFPEYSELESIDALKSKSKVVPVGMDFKQGVLDYKKPFPFNDVPLILWNHRWEYDKNPSEFFAILRELKERGLDFKLALCGESPGPPQVEFEEARSFFHKEIVHFGFADRARYDEILRESDIVISTSNHEFFGISVIEAMANHVFPILPNRLSYPELLPEDAKQYCLYKSKRDAINKIMFLLENQDIILPIKNKIQSYIKKFSWESVIGDYDDLL